MCEGFEDNIKRHASSPVLVDAVPAKYWPLLFHGGWPMYPVLQTSLFQSLTLKTARRGTQPVERRFSDKPSVMRHLR